MLNLLDLIPNAIRVVKMVMIPRAWSLYVCSTSLCLLGPPQSSSQLLSCSHSSCIAVPSYITSLLRTMHVLFCSTLKPKPEPVPFGHPVRLNLRPPPLLTCGFQVAHFDDMPRTPRGQQWRSRSSSQGLGRTSPSTRRPNVGRPPSLNPLRPAPARSTSAQDRGTPPAPFTTLSMMAVAMTAEATVTMHSRDRARAQAQAHQWSPSSTSPHSPHSRSGTSVLTGSAMHSTCRGSCW